MAVDAETHKQNNKHAQASGNREDAILPKEEEATASTEGFDAEEEDVFARSTLDLSNHPLPALDGLTNTLLQFTHLKKLDLSGMKSSMDNPNGLTELRWLGKAASKRRKGIESDKPIFGDQLNWLKLSDNPALGRQADSSDAFSGVERLTKLAMLNATSCSLSSMPPASTLMKLSSLVALILPHNSITNLSYIPYMPQLNTLVLSHNQLSKLPKDLPANLPSLKKLSITHNLLQWEAEESPLPDFTLCSHLREIRLSGNGNLARLPSHLASWGKGEGTEKKGTGLETFEANDCGLRSWESIKAILCESVDRNAMQRRRGMRNLGLKGNEVVKLPEYPEKILAYHPTLRTLDGEKLKRRKEIDHSASTPVVAEDRSASNLSQAPGKIDRSMLEPRRPTSYPLQHRDGPKMGEGSTKMRKRGRRGTKSLHTDTILPGSDTTGASSESSSHKKSDTTIVPKKEKEAPNLIPSAGKQKGSKPGGEARIGSNKLGSEKAQKSRKRKAWDADHDGKDVVDDTSTKRSRVDSDLIEQKVQRKSQTSVAAIIQQDKKPAEAKEQAPLWGRVGVKEAVLGMGGAWE